MKVLVIGNGGREHAICWKLSLSQKVEEIYCANGNAGISRIAKQINIKMNNFKALSEFVKFQGIDLTIVGPEVPLSDGIVDYFEDLGLKIFGPNKKAALLEASKIFAKEFMQRNNIPTANFAVFDDSKQALKYIQKNETPLVIKADGLAAGKGVFVCLTHDEAVLTVKNIMDDLIFGQAGKRIVIEEYLEGEEASILAFTDGKTVIPMVSAQDHKQAFDGDIGPNTGGMGVYSPAPIITDQVMHQIEEKILQPSINGLIDEGIRYVGVIYIGLMITNDGPHVLEYNARFGDPETQAILPRLKTDLIEIIQACLEKRLADIKIEWDNRACLCVVLCSGGYPDKYLTGLEISGLDEAEDIRDVLIFHAGTVKNNDKILTNGGRVLGITALGENIEKAQGLAYLSVQKIHFNSMYYRKDIGNKAIGRLIAGVNGTNIKENKSR